MIYSAAQAINLHVKNVPHDIRQAFTERAARAFVYHGGNNVVRKYETHFDGECGEWGMLVAKVKQELQGHFEAEIIGVAEFRIGIT